VEALELHKLLPNLLSAHHRTAKGIEPVALALRVDGCATNISLSMSDHQMHRPDLLGSLQSFYVYKIFVTSTSCCSTHILWIFL
jgi:hypothetical protein